jgi:hypothetical protein
MPATYEPIATTTLTTATATITFNSIPGTYTDLRLVFVGTVDSGGAGSGLRLKLNNDATSLYSLTEFYGTGASAASARVTGNAFAYLSNAAGLSTTTPMMATFDLFSYTASINKTALSEFNADVNSTSGVIERMVHLYRSTSAITRIDIYPANPNFASGTTATLYGILKA